MIALIVAAFVGPFDVQPQQFTAYYCRMVRHIDLLGHETDISPRAISVLVDGSFDLFEPKRTFDPTGLLSGRQFTVFRRYNSKALAALTSVGSTADPNPQIMTLQSLESGALFAMLGPVKGKHVEQFVGICHPEQGVTAEKFDHDGATK
jgi:hypothetical protein